MTRANKKPISKSTNLVIPPEFVRFATPETVANYRAERLACNKILEIGAGIGSQTIAFSKTCAQVLGIEKNKERGEILKKTIEELQIKNVEVIIGDALDEDISRKIKEFKPEIIFCDTERKASGERKIDEIKPKPETVIKKYSKVTERIAIEIPPFTPDTELLGEDFEKEFISIEGKLNRLTLYFNSLKKSEVSVVELPSQIRLEKREKRKINEVSSTKSFRYIHEINPAILLAEMIADLSKEEMSLINFEKKKLLLSKSKIESPFLKRYQIIKTCSNEEEIKKEIKKVGAGKVILRISINPEDYWKKRNFYENGLTGTKQVSIFGNSVELILAEDD